jgi:hypothetical protein
MTESAARYPLVPAAVARGQILLISIVAALDGLLFGQVQAVKPTCTGTQFKPRFLPGPRGARPCDELSFRGGCGSIVAREPRRP